MSDREEFSVYQEFLDGSTERVVAYVTGREAVDCAHRLVNSVGARIGTTTRIIITDGGDYTNFEWKYGEGVTFGRE